MIASLIFIFTVTSVLNDTKHNTGFRNPKLIISLLNDYFCFKAKAKPQNSTPKTSTCTHTHTPNTAKEIKYISSHFVFKRSSFIYVKEI